MWILGWVNRLILPVSKELPALVDVGSNQGIVVAHQPLVQPTVIIVPVSRMKAIVKYKDGVDDKVNGGIMGMV